MGPEGYGHHPEIDESPAEKEHPFRLPDQPTAVAEPVKPARHEPFI